MRTRQRECKLPAGHEGQHVPEGCPAGCIGSECIHPSCCDAPDGHPGTCVCADCRPRRGDAAREAAGFCGQLLGGLGWNLDGSPVREHCRRPRAAGSQFCHEHDPHRSAPRTADADLRAAVDAAAEQAGVKARFFLLPSGRWQADITGPGEKWCGISTPSLEKAVYFLVRRLGGAL